MTPASGTMPTLHFPIHHIEPKRKQTCGGLKTVGVPFGVLSKTTKRRPASIPGTEARCHVECIGVNLQRPNRDPLCTLRPEVYQVANGMQAVPKLAGGSIF